MSDNPKLKLFSAKLLCQLDEETFEELVVFLESVDAKMEAAEKTLKSKDTEIRLLRNALNRMESRK